MPLHEELQKLDPADPPGTWLPPETPHRGSEKLPDPEECPSCADGTHPFGTHLSARDYAETLCY